MSDLDDANDDALACCVGCWWMKVKMEWCGGGGSKR